MYDNGRGPQANRRLSSMNSAVPGGFFGRILAFAGTVVIAGLALMFSVVLFAIIATVGILAWGYFWWKTRDLRKQMREIHEQALRGQSGYRPPAGSDVIEGEVIREIRPGGEWREPPR